MSRVNIEVILTVLPIAVALKRFLILIPYSRIFK